MVSSKLFLPFCIHNHQPLGNPDFVVEHVCNQCYRPLLKMLFQYPGFHFSLHTSGPLFLYFEKHAKDMMELIGEMAGRGQMELMMSGFYEPVLSSIPRDDRRDQILKMKEYLKRMFGVEAEGLWLTERVWEPGLVEDLCLAGVQYVLVDDTHFLSCGFTKDELHQYFITEAEGKSVQVFPIDKSFRYLIPYKEVSDVDGYLRRMYADRKTMVIYGDDGEKFGAWPAMHRRVFDEGWMKNFLEKIMTLSEDFLKPCTFHEALRETSSAGLAYLPTSSYSEMEQWALLISPLSHFSQAGGEGENSKGYWKNFFVKYPEANRMHKKMLILSEMAAQNTEAKEKIYAAQCNDAYWHGVFGGIYMPHLRQAVWKQMADAESILRKNETLMIEEIDMDLDGKNELWVHSSLFSSILLPSEGGQMAEYTLFPKGKNYLNTLSRRKEAYHEKLIGKPELIQTTTPMFSLQDVQNTIQGLSSGIVYDRFPRCAFRECFFTEEDSLSAFLQSGLPNGASPTGYDVKDGRITFCSEAKLEDSAISVQKDFQFSPHGSTTVRYVIKNASAKNLSFCFGVEINLFLFGLEHPFSEPKSEEGSAGLTFPGEIQLGWDKARLWSYPVKTISQSEFGYEEVIQCVCFLPHWKISLSPGQVWTAQIAVTPLA